MISNKNLNKLKLGLEGQLDNIKWSLGILCERFAGTRMTIVIIIFKVCFDIVKRPVVFINRITIVMR